VPIDASIPIRGARVVVISKDLLRIG
jgi:hypothetical protein